MILEMESITCPLGNGLTAIMTALQSVTILMKMESLIGLFFLVHLLNRKRKDNNNPQKKERNFLFFLFTFQNGLHRNFFNEKVLELFSLSTFSLGHILSLFYKPKAV